MTTQYDCIIVGAGAAGCVLANRLSADPSLRVLLLEAGGRGFPSFSEIPLSVGALRGRPDYDWRFTGEPEPFLGNRRLNLPQGRVVGGSSAINGMVYLRGRASDFEQWRQMGNEGWSWKDVLPFFERAEAWGGSRGKGGLPVMRPASIHPLDDAFVRAGVMAGYPRRHSFNYEAADGFGYFDFNIFRGRRWTARRSYLRPALDRSNLSLCTRSQVSRIVFEGRRAVGVVWIDPEGRETSAFGKEVVLSAGAIGSPRLLMLSGLGDPEHLRAFGLSVVASSPGVGGNLQNHPDVSLRYSCLKPITLHSLLRADRIASAMIRAFVFRSGPASCFPGGAGGFLRSRRELTDPDLECHLVWAKRIADARLRSPFRAKSPAEEDGFSIRISLLNPSSRGTIRLASSDPRAAPLIQHRYLSGDADCHALAEGIRLMRDVISLAPFDPLRGAELEPGSEIADGAPLAAWVRANLDTQGHPIGTCRMGTDVLAVVDAQFAVHGVEGLRVVDASIMPKIPSANTFATTVMIAERAAEMIGTIIGKR